jgi:hypothetical protein
VLLICIFILMEAEAASAIKFSNNLWCSAPFILREWSSYNYISFFIHDSTRQERWEGKHFQLFSSSTSTSTCNSNKKSRRIFLHFALNGVIFGVRAKKFIPLKFSTSQCTFYYGHTLKWSEANEKNFEWEQWKCNMDEIFMICPPINRTLNGNIKGKHPSEIKQS